MKKNCSTKPSDREGAASIRDLARLKLAIHTLEQIAGFRRNSGERRLAVATLAFLRELK